MTTRIALWLALFLGAAIFADTWFFDSAAVIWLGRKLLDLLGWLTFWNNP